MFIGKSNEIQFNNLIINSKFKKIYYKIHQIIAIQNSPNKKKNNLTFIYSVSQFTISAKKFSFC